MTSLTTRKRTKFIVDFGSIPVSETLSKGLEGKIQQLALSLLAKTDYKGDIHLGGELPSETYGLILNGDGDGDGDESSVIGKASRRSVVFPCTLASSKAAGVKAIRVSRVKLDIHLEQLNQRQQMIRGFVLHPQINKNRKLTGAIMRRMGPTGGRLSLEVADRLALAVIVNELSQFTQSGGAGAEVGAVPFDFWGVISAGLSCGLASLSGGLDLVDDAACGAALAGELETINDGDDDGDDGDDGDDDPE